MHHYFVFFNLKNKRSVNKSNFCEIFNKMEKIKRKRAGNWVEDDKILLKELVKERVSCIENKNTDTNTNQKKKAAWLELEESFNNLSKGGTRTLSQLKSQWTLTKIVSKKEVAEHRREIQKTGGGPQTSDVVVSADDISVWLPNEFIVDKNEFDSDVVASEILQVEEECPAANSLMQSNNFDSEKESKEVLEKKVPKKKMKNLVHRNVADAKIKEVVDVDLKHREELHQLRVVNEEKIARNLDMEYKLMSAKYDLLKAKAEFFRNKQLASSD